MRAARVTPWSNNAEITSAKFALLQTAGLIGRSASPDAALLHKIPAHTQQWTLHKTNHGPQEVESMVGGATEPSIKVIEAGFVQAGSRNPWILFVRFNDAATSSCQSVPAG